MQTLSPLWEEEVESEWFSIEEALCADVPFGIVVVDCLRWVVVLVLFVDTTVVVFVARFTKLAFRTVPVRVRSACLKFCTYNCKALSSCLVSL